MCENERYSISEYGYEEDFNEDEVVDIISENFVFKRQEIIEIPREEYRKNISKVKIIEEKMDVTQGKLVIGYRFNIDYKNEKDYYSLVVGSNILGGGTSSKMFLNIREKESLCYYIYSSVEKYKGILFIGVGIAFENYDRTVELVKNQIESIKLGKITSEELENSKRVLTNAMKALGDIIGAMSDFYFVQNISKTNSTVEEIIKIYKQCQYR